jgi:hypothetical protein
MGSTFDTMNRVAMFEMMSMKHFGIWMTVNRVWMTRTHAHSPIYTSNRTCGDADQQTLPEIKGFFGEVPDDSTYIAGYLPPNKKRSKMFHQKYN